MEDAQKRNRVSGLQPLLEENARLEVVGFDDAMVSVLSMNRLLSARPRGLALPLPPRAACACVCETERRPALCGVEHVRHMFERLLLAVR